MFAVLFSLGHLSIRKENLENMVDLNQKRLQIREDHFRNFIFWKRENNLKRTTTVVSFVSKKDTFCVSIGIGNAQVEGVSYDSIRLPSDWYFQYKSLDDVKNFEKKFRRVSVSNGQERIMLERPSIPRPIVHPWRYVLPRPSFEGSSSQTTEKSVETIPSQLMLSPNDLYIPEAKPFLAVNKMFQISTS